jgi:peptidoglycan/LPS O-acetylase OafA/YrhL
VLVLSVVGRFWSLFAAEGYWDNFVMLLIMLTAVLVFGQVSYHYIERPMLKKTRAFEERIFPSEHRPAEKMADGKLKKGSRQEW